MKNIPIFCVLALILLSSGCAFNPEARIQHTNQLVSPLYSSDLYASYGTQIPDMSKYSKYSKCDNPLAIEIINDEQREEADLIYGRLLNPKLLTDHIVKYMADALGRMNVRDGKSTNRQIKLSIHRFDFERGFMRTSVLEMMVQIPEIDFKKIYSVKEYSGFFEKATSNAIHVLTWKVINDPIILDYITCTNADIRNKSSARETALEILNRRYASGEITKEQYEQMKNDIQK